MKKINRYFKVWWIMTRNSFLSVLNQKTGFTIFLIGKVLRFLLFFLFIVFLIKGVNSIAGYSLNQTLFFFLTFNLIDVFSQFLFREVYRFRPLIISGGFDLVLTKPMSALFRSLMGGVDIIDFATIPPLIIAIIVFGLKLNPSFINVIYYLLLLINGLILATAFHIVVLSLGIITLEIDHTIMIYRDLTSLARFPIDIYKEPIKSILTFFIPVGIMITLPAKAFMGLTSLGGVLWSLGLGAIFMFLSLKFWKFALKKYTSASS